MVFTHNVIISMENVYDVFVGAGSRTLVNGTRPGAIAPLATHGGHSECSRESSHASSHARKHRIYFA